MTEAERRLVEMLRQRQPADPTEIVASQWIAIINRMLLAAKCIEENDRTIKMLSERYESAINTIKTMREYFPAQTEACEPNRAGETRNKNNG